MRDYYPFGLTFNSYSSGQENLYKYNGGSELQNELSLYMTPNRMMDPALGRFWGIDALADMFTGISPMAFGYNNPLKFNDPTGLNPCENDDCEDTEPTVLPAITVTASRLPSSQPNYSSLLSQLSGSSNPIYRYLGRNYDRGNYGAIDRAFSNKSIHYSYGEELDESLREGKTSDALMMIASRGIGGAMIATYGAPILIETLAEAGAFSLSSSMSTNAILGRVGFEVTTQTAGNIAVGGLQGIRQLDVADVLLAGTGLNFIGSSTIGANIDVTPFSQGSRISGIGFGKGINDVGIDVGIGLVNPGVKSLGRSINSNTANKIAVGVLNSTISTYGAVQKQAND